MPLDEQQLLLEVREAVAGMTVDLARTRSHVEAQTKRLQEIGDALGGIRQRQDDHTGRITIIEADLKNQVGWRARLGGAWIGAGIVISAAASLIALGLSVFRH